MISELNIHLDEDISPSLLAAIAGLLTLDAASPTPETAYNYVFLTSTSDM